MMETFTVGLNEGPGELPDRSLPLNVSGSTIVLGRPLSALSANLLARAPFRSPPVFSGSVSGDLFPGARLAAFASEPVPATDLRQALAEFGRAVADAFRPLFDYLARMAHGIHRVLFPSKHRHCWTCHPERKPKPLAVNGHEYRRRLAARRRRRRR